MHLEINRRNGAASGLVAPQIVPRSVCVFGGARPGSDPRLSEDAGLLGEALAVAGIRLVYGGGAEGLMGTVARAAALLGGEVIAITPRFLADRFDPLPQAHQLIITADMHTRKRMMFERADAFVALPGGIGTIEELAEVITWHKLGQHRKPILIANFHDFWRPLLSLFEHLARCGFMRGDVLEECLVVNEPSGILPALQRATDQRRESAPPSPHKDRSGPIHWSVASPIHHVERTPPAM